MTTAISNTTYPNSNPSLSLKRQLPFLIYFLNSVLTESNSSNSNILVTDQTFISLDIHTDDKLLFQNRNWQVFFFKLTIFTIRLTRNKINIGYAQLMSGKNDGNYFEKSLPC